MILAKGVLDGLGADLGRGGLLRTYWCFCGFLVRNINLINLFATY